VIYFYLSFIYKINIANQFGQLGIGNVIRVNQPFNVSCFVDNNISIIDISCGKKHTLALSDQGIVFSWGSNEYGQLGLDVFSSQPKKAKYKDSQQLTSPSEFSGNLVHSKTNGEFCLSNKASPNLIEANLHIGL